MFINRLTYFSKRLKVILCTKNDNYKIIVKYNIVFVINIEWTYQKYKNSL